MFVKWYESDLVIWLYAEYIQELKCNIIETDKILDIPNSGYEIKCNAE